MNQPGQRKIGGTFGTRAEILRRNLKRQEIPNRKSVTPVVFRKTGAALFLLSALLLFPLLLGGAEKVVLIGEKTPVDQLTAALSSDPEIELLERLEIDAVLREHHLDALNGAVLQRLFPHADLIALLSASHLELFHAKTGAKLLSRSLDMRQAPRWIAEAAKKRAAPDARILSIAFVDIIDVPSAERDRIAALLLELQERLVNAEKILLLERDHLSAIQEERTLTGEIHPILPSETQIRCEFRQGSDAREITLELRLISADGNELLDRVFPDLRTMEPIAAEICDALHTPSSEVPFSAEAEAKRYFDEYYALLRRSPNLNSNLPPHTRKMRRVITAMRVLDPENPRYRYEEIFFQLGEYARFGLSWQERIAILNRFVRDAEAFLKRYPKWEFPKQKAGFTLHPTGLHSPIFNLFDYEQRVTPSPEEAAELNRLTDEIRAMHLMLDRKHSPGDRESISEQEGAIRYGIDLLPHFDAVKAMRLAWQADLDELALFRKHADKPGKFVRLGEWYFPGPFMQARGIWNRRGAWECARELLNTRLPEMEEAMKALPASKYEAHLAELKFLREYLNSDGSPETFKRIFRARIRHAVEHLNFRPSPRTSYGGLLETAARDYFGLRESELGGFIMECPWECLKEFGHSLSREDRAIVAVQQSADEELLQYAPEIRRLAYRGICRNDLGNSLQMLGSSLHQRLETDPLREIAYRTTTGNLLHQHPDRLVWEATLAELNGAFAIRSIPLPGAGWEMGSLFADGKYYTLRQAHGNKAVLYQWDPSTGRAEKLLETELPVSRPHAVLYLAGKRLWCGGRRWLGCFDLESRRWKLFTELPGEEIHALTVTNTRIFYLCGACIRGNSIPLSLHSCDPEGGDRRTIWDARSSRPELKTGATGEVSGFFPGRDGLLYFTVDDRKQALLLALDPKTESIRRIRRFPSAAGYFLLRRSGDLLLGEDGTYFGSAFYTLPGDDPAAEPLRLLAQHASDKRAARCRIPGYHAIQHPAVLRKNRWLCSAGDFGCWILDLENPEESPLLLLPEVSNVFYDEARDALYYPARRLPRIYEVKFK